MNDSSSSSTGLWNDTALPLPPVFVNQGTCEDIDSVVSVMVMVISGILAGFVRAVSDAHMDPLTSLFAFPFFVLVANHMYITFAQPVANSLGVDDGIAKFLPAIVGALLWGLSNGKKRILAAFMVAGIVSYFVAHLDTTASTVSVSVSVVVVLLFLELKAVKQFANEITMRAIMITTFLVLLFALWNPRTNDCGHPRNKLALCTPACGVVTTEFVPYTPAIATGITILLCSMFVGWLWSQHTKKQKLDTVAVPSPPPPPPFALPATSGYPHPMHPMHPMYGGSDIHLANLHPNAGREHERRGKSTAGPGGWERLSRLDDVPF